MLNRRKRLIVHCHHPQTLAEVRNALARTVEFVVAGDMPTLEAALRLYHQVDGLLVENRPPAGFPERALKMSAERLPEVPRIGLVDCEATSGVHTALASGLITRIVLMPFSSLELASAAGVEAAARHAAAPFIRRSLAG